MITGFSIIVIYNITMFTTEGTEYWFGQNLVDGAMTAIQTQILIGAMSTDNEIQSLKVIG